MVIGLLGPYMVIDVLCPFMARDLLSSFMAIGVFCLFMINDNKLAMSQYGNWNEFLKRLNIQFVVGIISSDRPRRVCRVRGKHDGDWVK